MVFADVLLLFIRIFSNFFFHTIHKSSLFLHAYVYTCISRKWSRKFYIHIWCTYVCLLEGGCCVYTCTWFFVCMQVYIICICSQIIVKDIYIHSMCKCLHLVCKSMYVQVLCVYRFGYGNAMFVWDVYVREMYVYGNAIYVRDLCIRTDVCIYECCVCWSWKIIHVVQFTVNQGRVEYPERPGQPECQVSGFIY